MSAASRWQRDLDSWAIPPGILQAAPESPWGFPVPVFARRADEAIGRHTPSNLRAGERLPEHGHILDVGCGGGAASLPLAPRARTITGVDSSRALLDSFRKRAESLGLVATTIEGRWPDISDASPVADVVVCHHVAYNVSDIAPFLHALTAHARVRVVLELTAVHPLSVLSPLWLRFHGLARPTSPTADDAVAVLRELGMNPAREDWEVSPQGHAVDTGVDADLVALTRRRLCLPADRDEDIASALAEQATAQGGSFRMPPRQLVTLWWDGRAVPD